MGGRPGRPRAQFSDAGLTSGEVAKQLGFSRSNVYRLQRTGALPGRLDRAGQYRFQPGAVAEIARKLRRKMNTDAERAVAVYKHFLAADFKPTIEAFARIVVETHEHPDTVSALWETYLRGAPRIEKGASELERISHEYDEQIAAMDQELARKRGAAFIPGEDDEAPPSSRGTGAKKRK